MSIADFFAKTEGRIRAEQALQDAEDRVFSYHEDEATDLPFHAKRDVDRATVLNARQRMTQEIVQVSARRNIAVTLVCTLVLLAKGVIDPAAIAVAVHAVFP